MRMELYRYAFEEAVCTEDIEAALLLAVWGCEALHGEALVQLDAGHFLDVAERKCVIDANTPVGRDLNKLFVAFLRREHGHDAFKVHRVSEATASAA